MSETNDRYQEHVERSEREYTGAYKAWLQGLSASQRRKVVQLGLDAPELERFETHQPERDVSEWVDLAAPTTPNRENFGEWLLEHFDLAEGAAQELAAFILLLIEREAERRKSDQLNRIVGLLLAPGNPVIRNHALAFAAGLNATNGLGRSQTEGAARIGASKQNFNKEFNRWRDLLGLPPSPHTKSEAARKRYSADKKANHWRTKKCTHPQSI